ncbi:MAG: alpha/beta fold hydrolase [Pseudomonadota bacterium]
MKFMIPVILFYLSLLIFLFIFQRSLQYMPSGKIQKISSYLLEGFVEKILTTSDGTRILAWYKPAEKGKKTILYFQGNAGNLGDRAHKFSVFAQDGFGVLGIVYHGYPGSEGKTSEAALIDDAKTALEFLSQQNIEKENIILFGESLGSGIAVQLAAKEKFAAVTLESPFSSAVSVAQKRYWFVPVSLLLKDKLESIKFASEITSPTLIFHGTADQIVDYSEGKKLFDAINAPKKLITVEGAKHLDFKEEFLLEEMKKFLAESS